jgi:hypothetical protein
MNLIYFIFFVIFIAIAAVVIKTDKFVEPKKEPKVPKPTPVVHKPLPKKSPSPKPPSRRPAPPSPNAMVMGLREWEQWGFENMVELKACGANVSSYGRNMKNGYSILNGTVKFEYDPVATDGKYFCYYNTEKHISVGFEKIEDFIKFYDEHLNELKEQIFLHSLQEDFN